MSIFDAETFMAATTTETNDTTVQPVPPGEYQAQIEKLDFRTINGKDGSDKYALDVTYDILDDSVKSALGRDKVTARQTVWIDLTSQGQIDTGKGKNIGLGKLRAAAGFNQAGQAFAPAMLNGAIVKIVTGLRADRNDPSIQYTDVKTVGSAN